MSVVKPYHVQIAEALGCKPVFESPGGDRPPIWRCLCPKPDEVPDGYPDGRWNHEKLPTRPRHVQLFGTGQAVARYDESWFASGPYFERYGLTIGRSAADGKWMASTVMLNDSESAQGITSTGHETPLLAGWAVILELLARSDRANR